MNVSVHVFLRCVWFRNQAIAASVVVVVVVVVGVVEVVVAVVVVAWRGVI